MSKEVLAFRDRSKNVEVTVVYSEDDLAQAYVEGVYFAVHNSEEFLDASSTMELIESLQDMLE